MVAYSVLLSLLLVCQSPLWVFVLLFVWPSRLLLLLLLLLFVVFWASVFSFAETVFHSLALYREPFDGGAEASQSQTVVVWDIVMQCAVWQEL